MDSNLRTFGYTSMHGIERDETPVGQKCFVCEKEFVSTDLGVSIMHTDFTPDGPVSVRKPAHIECFADMIVEQKQG